MKKSLIFLALGSVFATAQAADISVFGAVDTGLMFSHSKVSGESAENSLTMESSMNETSSFGIAGSEDLGNGMKVAFHLENEFASDSGSMATENKLFDREARITLEGGFGALSFGRMGTLSSATGTYDIVYVVGDSFDGGDNNIFGLTGAGVYDNMITYQTPEFAGFQVHAQYSFGASTNKDDDGITHTEGKTTTDRYYAIGATYKVGGLNLIGIVDSINEEHIQGTEDPDDTLRVTIGGSYDFGVVKPYVSAAYFKDGRMKSWMDSYKTTVATTTQANLEGDWDGYGVIIGASAPLVGGTAHMTIGYMDAEAQDFMYKTTEIGADLTRYTFAIGYEYPLSKRTKVYADAGYFKDEMDYGDKGWTDREPEGYQAAVGMIHYF